LIVSASSCVNTAEELKPHRVTSSPALGAAVELAGSGLATLALDRGARLAELAAARRPALDVAPRSRRRWSRSGGSPI